MSHNQSLEQVLNLDDCANEVLVEHQVIKDTSDPRLKYRREVEAIIHADHGEISALNLKILDTLRLRLGISQEEAFTIRAELLAPYREYRKNLQEYRRAFVEAVRREHLLKREDLLKKSETRSGLQRLQELLNLRDEDVITLETQVLQKRRSTDGNSLAIAVNIVGLILLTGIASWIIVSLINPVRQQQTSGNQAVSVPAVYDQ